VDRQRRLLRQDFSENVELEAKRAEMWAKADEVFEVVQKAIGGAKADALKQFNRHNETVKAFLAANKGYFTRKRMAVIERAMINFSEGAGGEEVSMPRGKGARAMAIAGLLFFFLQGCAMAQEMPWTNKEIVNAIYIAEGGKNAEYLYGIRSIACSSAEECREICFTTVKKNRSRFAKYGHRKFKGYVEFLASRYCPVGGPHASVAERRLNKNWIKNVKAILRKNRGRA